MMYKAKNDVDEVEEHCYKTMLFGVTHSSDTVMLVVTHYNEIKFSIKLSHLIFSNI